MANVFVSYNKADDGVAERLSNSLEAQGLSVFRDVDSLVAGEDFTQQIAETVSNADAVIVLLSGHSKRGKWVEHELELALEQEKTVVPILLDSDAKKNWIWPLVSDRQSVSVDDSTDFDSLSRQLKEAISGEYHEATVGPDLATYASSPMKRRLVGIISAVLFVFLVVYSFQMMSPPPPPSLGDVFVKVLDGSGSAMPDVTLSVQEIDGESVTTDIHGEASIPSDWLGRRVTIRDTNGQELTSKVLATDPGKVVLINVP